MVDKFLKSKCPLLVIILVTVFAYIGIFRNGFILDDPTFIVNWQTSHDFNIAELLKGAVPEGHQGVYRPVRSILYALYYQIYGTNPLGYHLHSLIVHLLSTILVYLIIKKLTKSDLTAFIAGLLFGLHPIHTESITYISASMEMTGVVFMLLAFYLYLISKELRNKLTSYSLSLIAATLAYFTYEMTLTLPILILSYEVVVKREKLKKLRGVWWFLVPAIVFVFIRVIFLHIVSRGDYLAYSFYHTMLTMPKVFMIYLGLIFYPVNISYIHELAPGFESFMTPYSNIQSILSLSILDPQISLSIVAILVLVALALKIRQKWTLVSFGIFWFFISLLPVSYFFPQGIALAEKYLYIPSIGVFLAVSVLLRYLISIERSKNMTIILLIVVSVTLLVLTFNRNRDWKDELTFWLKLTKQHPSSAVSFYTVGVHLGNQNNTGEAAQYYQKAIDLEPRFWQAYFNLGNIYAKYGEASKAGELYQKVLILNPGFAPAQQNLNR